jgi:hypothetical protein
MQAVASFSQKSSLIWGGGDIGKDGRGERLKTTGYRLVGEKLD